MDMRCYVDLLESATTMALMSFHLAKIPESFNPNTLIDFSVPKSQILHNVFDITGKKVAVLVGEIWLGNYRYVLTVQFNFRCLYTH
jgi:hypothetical protein